MRRPREFTSTMVALSVLLLSGFVEPVRALEGVVQINQARAIAGGVTDDDTPGFPVTISQSGSYRLTGNLELTSGAAVQVTAPHVSIDLNGFAIACSACDGTGIVSGAEAVTVRNGAVMGLGSSAITLQGEGSRIESVRAADTGGFLLGERCAVVGSTVLRSRNDGILCASDCLIQDNVVRGSEGNGIFTFSGAMVRTNTVRGSGENGIVARLGTVVENTVNGSGADGIRALNATISRNVVAGNQGDGIVTETGTVAGNTVERNGGAGVLVEGGEFLLPSLVSRNTISRNGGAGVRTIGGTSVLDNAISGNDAGIVSFGLAGGRVVVRNNTLQENDGNNTHGSFDLCPLLGFFIFAEENLCGSQACGGNFVPCT